MVPASFALVALRRFTDRIGTPDVAVDLGVLHRATRHAWLALEIALSAPAVHEHLAGLLPRARGPAFRQQIEVLLDLLGQAGLEPDTEESRRCLEELRLIRRWGFPTNGAAFHPSRNGAMGEADDEQSLAENDLEQAGYPHLAALVGLRTPWDEALVPTMLEYFLRRALPDLPADAGDDSWRCLETTALLLQEHEEVQALLDRPEEIGENDSEEGPDAEAVAALYQLGLNCSKRGEYRKATAHFTAAAKLDPTNALVYHQRGEAFRLLCEYERAIADFQMALRSSSASPSILVSRAIAYLLAGEHDRAIADCTAALALDPDHPGAYRTGQALRQNKGISPGPSPT
jgi:tetratricopeptide (TPR) repeat protein